MAAVEPPPAPPVTSLKKVGMTLVTSVGGASGPLYGTFFLRAATAAGDATVLDGAALLALRGRARGDRRARQGGGRRQDHVRRAGAGLRRVRGGLGASGAEPDVAARAAADAAAAGRDATEPMLALKGRASYLGERSVGHLDPGAASSALLLAALADTLES